MNVRDNEVFTPIDLINAKTISSVINSFFGTNALSQFMDQTNPLAAVSYTHLDDIETVEVSLKVVKPETAENKEAGVKVLVPNGELYAKKVCDTFEEAVDLCLEALEKQLVKYKEKQRSKDVYKRQV